MEKLVLALGALLLLGATVYLTQKENTTLNTQATQVPSSVLDLYGEWKRKNNRKYASSEQDQYRLKVFYQNYLHIQNFYQSTEEQTYELGFTQFMDITNEEFQAMYLGYNGPSPVVLTSVESDDEVTNDVDWTNKGAVTPVKNQGQCGSCWSFSTTGALEGYDFVKNGKLRSFSEQQLVDCSSNYGNQGCNGGLMDSAFDYVRDKGVTSESSYPYSGRDGSCKSFTSIYKIAGHTDVKAGDCKALEKAVADQPVSVAVDANNWQFYSGGVFSNCGTSLDHGVLLVGVTADAWKIKNSWGTSWGESGFIRLRKGNTCGVCNSASYPK